AVMGAWDGSSAPLAPVGALTFFLMGAIYCLAVSGRPRSYAKAGVAAVVALFCLARLYLAVDHPDDVVFGVALGVAVPLAAFRFFTPNEVFPVVYRRGRGAPVGGTGRGGAAVRQGGRGPPPRAVPPGRPGRPGCFGGASTPLRLTVEGDPDQYLFGKLYTRGHVRADRWYKLWRTILYGALEDEHPFSSVRQLTQYEDYMLRLLRDSGVRTAAPHGIVEITPEGEYLLVTEFFTGAVEIGEAEVDDNIIDRGLLLIRKLWDAGIAHRDIKPGNLMVCGGQLLLIDVFFAQVRPSPWRQAVDLGNMMLVLAVRTDPGRVCPRALHHFTPPELAYAFAASPAGWRRRPGCGRSGSGPRVTRWASSARPPRRGGRSPCSAGEPGGWCSSSPSSVSRRSPSPSASPPSSRPVRSGYTHRSVAPGIR